MAGDCGRKLPPGPSAGRECPRLLPTLVIADEPQLAAQTSSVLALRGAYLPVVDGGPRMTRPDWPSEVIRRTNSAARARANLIVLAGVEDETCEELLKRLPREGTIRVSSALDISGLPRRRALKRQSMPWGRNCIGVGLLRALRSRAELIFTDDAPQPTDHVPALAEHLVVCEKGDELAQVIAANYAYAHDAGLYLIPQVPDAEAEEIL